MPDRRNWMRRIVNIFTAIWHPLIIQMMRLPSAHQNVEREGMQESVWAEDLECFMLSTYVFLEMFYITSKIIYIIGDIQKLFQKNMERLRLYFSFLLKTKSQKRTGTVSWTAASTTNWGRIKTAQFLPLFHWYVESITWSLAGSSGKSATPRIVIFRKKSQFLEPQSKHLKTMPRGLLTK